jgi:hypothetical protein
MPSDPRVPLPQEEAPRMYRWPDGQVRPEAPYRCGAFRVGDSAVCWLLSDHDGPHCFDVAPSPSRAGAPAECSTLCDGTYHAPLCPRRASSGGAPAGDPTPESDEEWLANLIRNLDGSRKHRHELARYRSILARLSGSVSPPPSGEERPALTREETGEVRRILEEASRHLGGIDTDDTTQPVAIRIGCAEGALRAALERLASSSSVPSETGETARLRAALARESARAERYRKAYNDLLLTTVPADNA